MESLSSKLTHRVVSWHSLVSDEYKPDATDRIQIWAADFAAIAKNVHSVAPANNDVQVWRRDKAKSYSSR